MISKITDFFKNIKILHLVFIAILLEVVGIFTQKYFPTIALTFQLISFVIFIYAAIKFFNKKF